MKRYLFEILAKYAKRMAIASNGKCWIHSYSEKVPPEFNRLVHELNQTDAKE
jgi:hypothetical protein